MYTHMRYVKANEALDAAIAIDPIDDAVSTAARVVTPGEWPEQRLGDPLLERAEIRFAWPSWFIPTQNHEVGGKSLTYPLGSAVLDCKSQPAVRVSRGERPDNRPIGAGSHLHPVGFG